ncbi:hypothetical protein [Nocardioides mangrovi]|uniref:DUF2079 domain-containing protein n=1 Tax=Nocardioides mangrovi TaxID=2874580 RepID=A0ABS7U9U5_9ACTN|nr:hypothetical protein [Nocardioides mangrovi]MBZ5737496.1 hypothetical protein [Nocardioides mangrovi]
MVRRWWVPLALYAGVALVYLLTISPDPSPDVFTADFAARHIALTGDPVPHIPDFPRLDDNPIRETWIVETADGREAVGRAPGVIAAVVPAYWLLRPGTVSAVPGGITAALVTAGTVTLLFSLLRRHLGDRRALLAALLFGLTTPMWSVAANGVWPHTLTSFGIIGSAWAADRGRWWLVGLFGGVILWGRLHASVIVAVLGVGVACVRRRPSIALRVGAVSAGMLALMMVWTHWMYGRWDPSSGYRAGDFTGNAAGNAVNVVNFLGFFVSPDRGLLVWTPLVALLTPALVRAWRDLPDWSRSLLVGGLVYLAIQGLLVRFSGGDQFYGYRTSLELLACATPALALSADRMGPLARRLFTPLAVLQLVMIVPGAVLDDFYVDAADVWRHQAFVNGVLDRPLVMALFVAGSLVAARVVAMWMTDNKPRSTSPLGDHDRRPGRADARDAR